MLGLPNDFAVLDDSHIDNATSAPASPLTLRTHIDDIETDPLVTSYYRHFHKFHPFLLPRKSLIRLHKDETRQLDFTPLIAAMRLVGHIYAAKEWSVQLKDHVEACILQTPPTDPVLVQCRLLYSVALFWNSYKIESNREMKSAVKVALDLEMFHREFASAHGAGDPVLTECWKRTWWMLYIIDAYYAGTLGTMNFAVVDVDMSVDLPCEELEYESGVSTAILFPMMFLIRELIPFQPIPVSKTLADFDCREFTTEDTSFSSFAYLISAVRCAALAISISPKVAAKEDSADIIHSADSIIDAWPLLLPKERKQIMTKTGDIDEIMFQAHLLIHV